MKSSTGDVLAEALQIDGQLTGLTASELTA